MCEVLDLRMERACRATAARLPLVRPLSHLADPPNAPIASLLPRERPRNLLVYWSVEASAWRKSL